MRFFAAEQELAATRLSLLYASLQFDQDFIVFLLRQHQWNTEPPLITARRMSLQSLWKLAETIYGGSQFEFIIPELLRLAVGPFDVSVEEEEPALQFRKANLLHGLLLGSQLFQGRAVFGQHVNPVDNHPHRGPWHGDDCLEFR